MDAGSIFSIIGALLGGGIIIKFWEEYKKKGKIEASDFNVIMYTTNISYLGFITSFQVDIQFINTSGHQKIIEGIKRLT